MHTLNSPTVPYRCAGGDSWVYIFFSVSINVSSVGASNIIRQEARCGVMVRTIVYQFQ